MRASFTSKQVITSAPRPVRAPSAPRRYRAVWSTAGAERVWSIDQDLWIAEAPPSTCWALTWQLGDGALGSLGVAKGGPRRDGVSQDAAFFAVRGPGEAHQVHRVPFVVPLHSFVRLRVFCVHGEGQHHWVAWLRDDATGRALQIGRFALATREPATGLASESIYYGPAASRDTVPPSLVYWTAPRCNEQPDGTFAGVPALTCAESAGEIAGSVMPWSFGWAPGARVRAGGPP
jgi:hypothetical protein